MDYIVNTGIAAAGIGVNVLQDQQVQLKHAPKCMFFTRYLTEERIHRQMVK